MSEFALKQPVIYRGKTYTFPGEVCGITDDGQVIVRAIGTPEGYYAGMKHIFGPSQLEPWEASVTPSPVPHEVGTVTVPKQAVLGALAEFQRSQKVNPEYDLIDHLQNAMAEVWPAPSDNLTDMASSNKGPSRGGDEPLGQYRKQRPDVQQAGGPNVPPDQQSWVIFENLLVAAEKVLAGLNARIDAADKRAVPVFHGIVDLHDAIHEARAALATATEGSGE